MSERLMSIEKRLMKLETGLRALSPGGDSKPRNKSKRGDDPVIIEAVNQVGEIRARLRALEEQVAWLSERLTSKVNKQRGRNVQ